MKLVAYKVDTDEICDRFQIVPAQSARDWMGQTTNRFAYRCLPMVIANQLGWSITCPVSFEVIWNGDRSPTGVEVRFFEDSPEHDIDWSEHIVGHFGEGILTFVIPYLFRTDPGFGLIVRGPTNNFRRGIAALDGFVETDWHDFTFSMNWKLTDPNLRVKFNRGESICMIIPLQAAQLGEFSTEILHMRDDKVLEENVIKKGDSRREYNSAPKSEGDWQKFYVQGIRADGVQEHSHLTKITLGEFKTKEL